jgi:hypothetical protein
MDAAGRRKRVGGQAATRGGRIRTIGAAEGFFENAQAVFCKNATKSEFLLLGRGIFWNLRCSLQTK